MAEPLMQAADLAKSYGPVVALRSADLVVEPGEVHALLGANGAGKSTLVKILTGVIQADRGTVKVNGKAVRMRSPAQAARIGLAPVFQDPALVPDLTIVVEPAPDRHGSGRRPAGAGRDGARASTSASSWATCRCRCSG